MNDVEILNLRSEVEELCKECGSLSLRIFLALKDTSTMEQLIDLVLDRCDNSPAALCAVRDELREIASDGPMEDLPASLL